MKQDKDKIKDIFSSKLKNFEAEVSPFLWDDIQETISPAAEKNIPARKRIILRYASIAASIALILVPSLLLWLNNTNVIKSVLQTESSTLQAINTSQPVTENLENKITPPAQNRLKSNTTDKQIEVVPVSNIPAPYHEEENSETSLTGNQEDSNEKQIVIPQTQPTTDTTSNEPSEFIYARSHLQKEEARENKLLVGLNTNSSFFSSESSKNTGQVGLSAKSAEEEFSAYRNQYTENKDFVIDHNQPITFGLNIAKSITSKLAVETGIFYTYASSKIKSNGTLKVNEKQSLYYWGIPVNLNYNFLELGDVDFYATTGVAIQKDFQGYQRSTVINPSNRIESNIVSGASGIITEKGVVEVKNNIRQDHPQVSARLGLGVSYPIVRDINVYGNVGGAYFFKAGNEHRTIYSDKKKQFDINVGLKLNIN